MGREEGSGCKSQRQNPASFGFSDISFGGKIRWRKSNIAAECASHDSILHSNWEEHLLICLTKLANKLVIAVFDKLAVVIKLVVADWVADKLAVGIKIVW